MDVQTLELVRQADGLSRAKDLALVQAEQAIEAVLPLSPSPAREGLIQLAMLVVNRTR
jgi:geranylgeranyl pyrophosphate synthase